MPLDVQYNDLFGYMTEMLVRGCVSVWQGARERARLASCADVPIRFRRHQADSIVAQHLFCSNGTGCEKIMPGELRREAPSRSPVRRAAGRPKRGSSIREFRDNKPQRMMRHAVLYPHTLGTVSQNSVSTTNNGLPGSALTGPYPPKSEGAAARGEGEVSDNNDLNTVTIMHS